jgi:hypothetical protein
VVPTKHGQAAVAHGRLIILAAAEVVIELVVIAVFASSGGSNDLRVNADALTSLAPVTRHPRLPPLAGPGESLVVRLGLQGRRA